MGYGHPIQVKMEELLNVELLAIFYKPFYYHSFVLCVKNESNCEYMNEQIQHSNEFIHNCLQKKNFSLFEKKGLNRSQGGTLRFESIKMLTNKVLNSL